MSCIQPIIIELGLVKHSYQRKKSKVPTCIDIINQLLLDKIITDQDIQNVYNKLCTDNNNNSNNNSITHSNQDKEQHQPQQQSELNEVKNKSATYCDNDNKMLYSNEKDEKQSQLNEEEKQLQASTSTTTTTTTTTHCDNDLYILEKDITTSTSVEATIPIETIRRRHIAFHVYYDGETYNGLAENIGSKNDTSVEREIFHALLKSNLISTTNRESIRYSRCGRTDKGVSSCGQIIAFYLKSAIPIDASIDEDGSHIVNNNDIPTNAYDTCKVWIKPRQKQKNNNNRKNKVDNNHNNLNNNLNDNTKRIEKVMNEYSYDKILNNILPNNIRILGWCIVSDDFSARFSTTSRIYRYFFMNKPNIINIKHIHIALQLLIGIHDYRNFCKMDIEKVYNYKRHIIRAELIELNHNNNHNNICYFEIEGQAFLWHQIRCIVHILFLIGYELEQPTIITELLNIEKYNGKPNYPLANEIPLVLHQCLYQNLYMNYSVQNLWSIQCILEQQYEYHLICIARIQNCIQHIQKNSNILSKDLIEFTKQMYERRHKKNKHNNNKKLNNNNNKNMEYDNIINTFSQQEFLSWNDAILFLNKYGFYTNSDHQITDISYTPLLLRSKGTTYEEKVNALLNNNNNTKRKIKYEQNVIQKRKTKEEDSTFYNHMSKQGTSSTLTSTTTTTTTTTTNL